MPNASEHFFPKLKFFSPDENQDSSYVSSAAFQIDLYCLTGKLMSISGANLHNCPA